MAASRWWRRRDGALNAIITTLVATLRIEVGRIHGSFRRGAPGGCPHVRENVLVNSHELSAAFEEVFDQSIVFHGFAEHLRDYDVFIYATADPRTGIKPEYLRYRFTHCVRASVKTAISQEVWARSLDARLLDHQAAIESGVEGYVWGVNFQVLYPGMSLQQGSTEAAEWAGRLGMPFHEAHIETNGHNVELVFSDLVVTNVEAGFAPFAVPSDGPDFKWPMDS